MRILQTSLVLTGEGQKDPGYRVDNQADGPCFFSRYQRRMEESN
jgi:hypothetical protein